MPLDSRLLLDLQQGRVHLWEFSLPLVTPAPIRQTLLPIEEQDALESTHASLRATYRCALRFLLSHYTGINPRSLSIRRTPFGKPYLTVPAEIEFNLSHSRSTLMIAFAWKTPVGIDVEDNRTIKRLEQMAQRCLSPEELQHWACLKDSEKTDYFLRLWVRKEALCKASGQGISLGLQNCSSSLNAPPVWLTVPTELGAPQSWQLIDLPLGSYRWGALTLQKSAPEIAIGKLNTLKSKKLFEKLVSLL